MPWTRPNRWILCLLLLTAFSVGMAVHVVVAHKYDTAPQLSETESRVVTACLTLAVVIGGFARSEIVTRKKAHDIANFQQALSLQVADASQAAATAATKAQVAADVVDKRLNGELDKRIRDAVREELASQLPAVIESAYAKFTANPPPKAQA